MLHEDEDEEEAGRGRKLVLQEDTTLLPSKGNSVEFLGIWKDTRYLPLLTLPFSRIPERSLVTLLFLLFLFFPLHRSSFFLTTLLGLSPPSSFWAAAPQ